MRGAISAFDTFDVPQCAQRQQPALLLRVEGGAAGKPGLELVALFAFQPVKDHEASFACIAEARTTWNGRSCWSEGMRWRACCTSLDLTSATMTEG